MTIVKAIFIIMANFTVKVFTEVIKFLTPLKHIFRPLSSSCQIDLHNIRSELEKFDGGEVNLEMDDQTGIAVITLNNPGKLNSLTGHMIVAMADHITKLENWSSGKGVILMGSEGNFCSGGDLTFVRKALHYGAELSAFQHHTLTRLLNLPLISVALLQGHTLGGGAELSTACDFRVMSSSAKIGFVQIKMGVTTGWGATPRLVHLLGRKKTLDLVSSAKVLTAEEAQSEGLVDHVLPYSLAQNEEQGECKKWLLYNYCKHNADLTQAVKTLVVDCDSSKDMDESLKKECQVFAKFWGGPAQRAALEAKIKHK